MREHDRRVIHSSICPNWRTPQDLYQRLEEEFGFLCDIAADSASSKCGDQFYGPGSAFGEDALAVEAWAWPGFLNPPWSREEKLPITPWIDKLIVQSREGWSGVSILPASVQTQWWQRLRTTAYEIRLIPHRVSFELSQEDLDRWNAERVAAGKPPKVKPDNAGGNTAVVVWKPLRRYIGGWEAGVRYWTYRDVIPGRRRRHEGQSV